MENPPNSNCQAPTLELLVGNIASGKSTWTAARAEQGWLTIENDSLLRSLHGGRYVCEEQVPGMLDALAREIITAAAAAFLSSEKRHGTAARGVVDVRQDGRVRELVGRAGSRGPAGVSGPPAAEGTVLPEVSVPAWDRGWWRWLFSAPTAVR